MKKITIPSVICGTFLIMTNAPGNDSSETTIQPIAKTAAEWKQELTPEEYRVLRQEGTERPGTSDLLKEKRSGVYTCAACDLPVFSSLTKFDSGTGWPSYHSPINPDHVDMKEDRKFWSVRTEVHCARCKGHLGHVFKDGPRPTGLRYCINGAALDFVPAEKKDIDQRKPEITRKDIRD